jgi:hypothetical protein
MLAWFGSVHFNVGLLYVMSVFGLMAMYKTHFARNVAVDVMRACQKEPQVRGHLVTFTKKVYKAETRFWLYCNLAYPRKVERNISHKMLVY